MEMATAATTTTTPGRKSPDPECETPTRIQPGKPVSVSNGVLKRHHNHHHHRSPPLVKVYYKECLKNHAASIGGHALDGCGEFMPSPGSSSADPTSLNCAACGCHRNFHSREPDDSPPLPLALPPPSATTGHHAIEYHPHHRHHPPPPPRSPSSASPPPISSSYYPHSAPHMLLALSSPPESHPHLPPTNAVVHRGSGSRKRFRTKFTQNQKERMLEFAEQLGWKVQKKDEETMQEFCHEVGVDRNVLKVWMHNNKNTFGSKSKEGLPAINGSGGIDLDDHVGRSGSMAHMGTNGSSSSS